MRIILPRWVCHALGYWRRALPLGAALAIGMLMTGCLAVGPDYQAPEAPGMTSFSSPGDPDAKARSEVLVRWWEIFNDPVLNDLIAIAYYQNLTLREAGVRVMQARAQLGIAFGNQWPQSQDVAFSYLYVDPSSSGGETGIPSIPAFDLYQGTLAATWELDFWGKYRRQVESDAAELQASIADYDDALITLISSVASTYVTVRQTEEQLVLTRQNIELQLRTLELTEDRYEAGAVSELDVTQATANLTNTQAEEPSLEQSLIQAKNALSLLLGLPPGQADKYLGSGRIPTAPSQVAIGLPAELLMRRPDIREAERQAAAQCALIGVATADLFPSISLTGSVGFSTQNLAHLFLPSSFTAIAGPQIQWNLLQYGRILNNMRVQDALFQELAIAYQQTVLEAYGDVEDALAQFLLSQQRTMLLAESVQATKRSVEISLEQYREGEVDFIRVLDAQGFLVQQEDAWTQSRADIALGLISLYQNLGGGWEIRVGHNYIPQQTVEEMRSAVPWGNMIAPEPPPIQTNPPFVINQLWDQLQPIDDPVVPDWGNDPTVHDLQ